MNMEADRRQFWAGQPVTAVRSRASSLGSKFRKTDGFKNKQDLIDEIIAAEIRQEATAVGDQGGL